MTPRRLLRSILGLYGFGPRARPWGRSRPVEIGRSPPAPLWRLS